MLPPINQIIALWNNSYKKSQKEASDPDHSDTEKEKDTVASAEKGMHIIKNVCNVALVVQATVSLPFVSCLIFVKKNTHHTTPH